MRNSHAINGRGVIVVARIDEPIAAADRRDAGWLNDPAKPERSPFAPKPDYTPQELDYLSAELDDRQRQENAALFRAANTVGVFAGACLIIGAVLGALLGIGLSHGWPF